MASKPRHSIEINRVPVLTLWATVVAERLGQDHDAALTLGKAVAGLNAQSKGRRLGIFKPSKGKKHARARSSGLKSADVPFPPLRPKTEYGRSLVISRSVRRACRAISNERSGRILLLSERR